MIYIDRKGNKIKDFNDWGNYFLSDEKKKKDWKESRSSQSIAKFMLNHEGEKKISNIISELMGEEITLEEAIPEYEVKFDKFRNGREHDLGIFGKTDSGKSIFIGVESKVDETFNEKIIDVYLKSKSNELNGMETNAPQRIENLLRLNFRKIIPSLFNLRYQLLYSTVGTLAVKADISILLIIVFNTVKYNPEKSKQNLNDYIKFLQSVNAQELSLDGVKLAHKIRFDHQEEYDNKELYSIYHEVKLD